MRISSPNSLIAKAGRAAPTEPVVEKSLVAKELAELRSAVEALAPAIHYDVQKSLDEERYTFGPLYTPDEIDVHGEWTTASELQKAMWTFVRSGNRQIRKQHNSETAVGEVVDSVVWPYPAEVDLALPGREVRKATLPAGTAYVGVVWTPEAWPAVKGGTITGYSLGGRAMRVRSGEMLPPMRKSADEIPPETAN